MATDKAAEKQLAQFIGRFSPDVARVARAALVKMRARLPGALRLVYDNYNALAIGFGPTERASDALFSIAVCPRWVSLFFLTGATLADPKKILKGSGSKVRHVVLTSAADLDAPAVRALMAQALDRARTPLDPRSPGRLVIKAIAAKQRPRRPAAPARVSPRRQRSA